MSQCVDKIAGCQLARERFSHCLTCFVGESSLQQLFLFKSVFICTASAELQFWGTRKISPCFLPRITKVRLIVCHEHIREIQTCHLFCTYQPMFDHVSRSRYGLLDWHKQTFSFGSCSRLSKHVQCEEGWTSFFQEVLNYKGLKCHWTLDLYSTRKNPIGYRLVAVSLVWIFSHPNGQNSLKTGKRKIMVNETELLFMLDAGRLTGVLLEIEVSMIMLYL